MFKFFKKKPAPKLRRTEIASREAIDALHSLVQKFSDKSVQELSDEFFDIVKTFFSSFFNIRYQFTHTELKKELESRKGVPDGLKQMSTSFWEDLANTRYKNESMPQGKLEQFIKDFADLIHALYNQAR